VKIKETIVDFTIAPILFFTEKLLVKQKKVKLPDIKVFINNKEKKSLKASWNKLHFREQYCKLIYWQTSKVTY
jgi:hypothetical protein